MAPKRGLFRNLDRRADRVGDIVRNEDKLSHSELVARANDIYPRAETELERQLKAAAEGSPRELREALNRNEGYVVTPEEREATQ